MASPLIHQWPNASNGSGAATASLSRGQLEPSPPSAAQAWRAGERRGAAGRGGRSRPRGKLLAGASHGSPWLGLASNSRGKLLSALGKGSD